MSRTWKLSSIFILLLILLIDLTPLAAQEDADPRSPEQQLVDRYAPTMMLRRQAHACDPAGEPYMPLPVEAVLDDPSVLLRQNTGDNVDASFDPVVTTGPSMDDIAGLGPDYYLDFPGNPLEPGCRYEQWSRSKLEEFEPTIYARIATWDDQVETHEQVEDLTGTPTDSLNEEEQDHVEEIVEDDTSILPSLDEEPEINDGLVVQYWIFFVYNDFNNKHEGDWEMIQLNFEADTVEDALKVEPRVITLAQHGGSERANWTSERLDLDGLSPRIYSAAGSHSSHYENQLYIGWGENGTGFGCDDTRTPTDPLKPKVVLMPSQPTRTGGPMDWLSFEGRWGEKEVWEFNGPRGPVRGGKWYRPITWMYTARERSFYIPEMGGLGPMPGGFFCGLTDIGAQALIQLVIRPWVTLGVVAAMFAAAVWVIAMLRRRLVRAFRVYFTYRGSFTSLGMILIPLGLLVTVIQQILITIPPLSWGVEFIGQTPVARLVAAWFVGGLLGIVENVVVGPAVISLMEMIRKNRPTDARLAYKEVLHHLPELARGWLTIVPGLILRALTIVGIPFALRNRVRWAFYTQSIMVHNTRTWRGARAMSAVAVSGSWWATAAQTLLYAALTILPSPLIGIVLLIMFSPSIEFVNIVSSFVYAFAIPFKFIAMTLMYYDRVGLKEGFIDALRREDERVAEKVEADSGPIITVRAADPVVPAPASS